MHTLFISVPPFSSKLDFNFNAWYKSLSWAFVSAFSQATVGFLLANTSSTLVFVLLSFGHGFRLCSQSASCRRLCFWNLPVSCLSAVLAWPPLQQTEHNQSLASASFWLNLWRTTEAGVRVLAPCSFSSPLLGTAFTV